MVEAEQEVRQLMLTGVDQFMNEKEVIKYLRKMFSTEQEIPCEGVAKKRGNAFAFICFSANEQKERFQELFERSGENKKSWRVKENTQRPLNKKKFKMVQETLPKNREKPLFEPPTQEVIEQELKQSVVQRVTPYAHLSYEEQIKAKKEWLKGILESFNSSFFK